MYIGLISDTHGTFDAPLMKFLQPVDQVDPKLTIYSIVNSITASGSAGKVQILVNGETNLSYQETIDISQPFSMNADLIEEEE